MGGGEGFIKPAPGPVLVSGGPVRALGVSVVQFIPEDERGKLDAS